MSKIKVLHITQSIGGVETYLRLLIENIDRNKFEILIASSEQSIHRLCEMQHIKHYFLPMTRGFNPFLDAKSFFDIRRIIKKERPDLVHLHSSKAGFIGRMASKSLRCKSLFTPHGGAYLSFTGLKRLIYFFLELISKHYTYRLLAISHSEATRFVYELGIKEDNIFIIPNSLKIPDSPVIVPPSDKLNELTGDIKIGTIGRITYQKNPLLFAAIAQDIISQYPNAHFYFLGAGFHDHLRPELEEKVREYGIENNFHLIEKGDQNKALNFLRKIDIFLLPSLYEGLSYALLEAMLECVPCVVSKCEGNNDVINSNENGFACLTKEDFSKVIQLLIIDKEKAKKIGMKGHQYVRQNHDIKNNIKMLEQVYSKISIEPYFLI